MTSHATKTHVKRGTDCIGVAISFVLHDGHGNVLLHKRGQKCRDEQGNWDTGGGALEFSETFDDAMTREVKEEFGCDVLEAKFLGTLNVLRQHNGAPTHWVSICYAIKIDPNQVVNGEPHKIEELSWFTPDSLPSPQHTTLTKWIAMAVDAGIL